MKRVLVMGLGRFGGGVAAVRWFARHGDEVRVTDRSPEAELEGSVRQIAGLGAQLRLGGHDPSDFDWADVVVVNPAVPFDQPLVERARAAGKEIATEMGLTLARLPGPVVAVTGTNGKSTTASLAAAMLEASGVPVALGGNIGRSLLNETETMDAATVAVLEISSFQLAWLEHDRLAPCAAIVTNVTGDHFDKHPTFEHYAAAKRRLVEAVPEAGLVVLREEDPVCREFADHALGRVVWFGGRRPPPVPLENLRLAGRHNRANAAAAASAVASFQALPHRLELLEEARGISFVDDAVSTTPVATAAAVAAFGRPVVLLTGGRDKGLDWTPLLEAARSARVVVAYGETGPDLHARLPGSLLCETFDGAVRRALDVAGPGDVVLLSPGFTSYDEFTAFDARGARFRELVSRSL